MDIRTLLRRESVVTDLNASNKEALLKNLARRAAPFAALDGNTIATALIDRENLGSTGIGDGIAIPHARLADIAKPLGMLARAKRPIPFDAVDGIPIDIVFMILLPISSHGGGHLNALACAARRLRADGVAQAIRRAPDDIAIYDLITENADHPS